MMVGWLSIKMKTIPLVVAVMAADEAVDLAVVLAAAVVEVEDVLAVAVAAAVVAVVVAEAIPSLQTTTCAILMKMHSSSSSIVSIT
jgi:hypothetical protein